MEMGEILIQDVPVAVRDALIADAQARNISINEAAVSLLADIYRVRREPSTRPFRGASGSTQLLLVGPLALRDKIKIRAAKERVPMKRLVIGHLADHYQVEAAA